MILIASHSLAMTVLYSLIATCYSLFFLLSSKRFELRAFG